MSLSNGLSNGFVVKKYTTFLLPFFPAATTPAIHERKFNILLVPA
jgi:hypothetical protein